MTMPSLYQVLGTSVAPLLAREGTLKIILNKLRKKTPDNISIIGPKYIGKSVLLNGLAEILHAREKLFEFVLYWDVRHQTPQTDAEFFDALRVRLRDKLVDAKLETAELLDLKSNSPYQEITDVVSYLEKENQKVLIVLDGIDDLLRSDTITKNLWDNLRSLAQHSNFRIVTGSRKRLRDLCARPESRTSDFWTIFSDPVEVARLGADDWPMYVQPLHQVGVGFEKGVMAELENWTGGVPILVSLILRTIDPNRSHPVTREEINSAAEGLLENCDHLEALWDDCDVQEKIALARLSATGPIAKPEIPKDVRVSIVNRGYGSLSDDRLSSSCRIMERHALLHGRAVSNLALAIGTSDSYKKNIKGVLEIRFEQAAIEDDVLRDLVGITLREVDRPHVAVQHVRGVVDRTFHLIWAREVPDGKVPDPWIRVWQHSGFTDYPTEIPRERYKQVSLLNLCVKHRLIHVSQATSILIGNLHQVGNFGHHKDDERLNLTEVEVPFHFMISVGFSLIEMASQLSTEQKQTQTQA